MRMLLVKPLPAPAMRRSLRCAALRAKMGRLRRRKSCRRLPSAMKKKTQSRSPLRVRPQKKALRKSRSGKARANGADGVVVEEADVTVLRIAVEMSRQPAIAASVKSRRKQQRKSAAKRNRRATLKQGTSGMKAVR